MRRFQSLSRDSVYSNGAAHHRLRRLAEGFNPSVGIAFIQTWGSFQRTNKAFYSFNPSVGIAFIQTERAIELMQDADRFNPSVGIAFIQTNSACQFRRKYAGFQSLSRDSVYSNRIGSGLLTRATGFNPSVGIAFIQTTPNHRLHKVNIVSIPQSG